MGVTGAVRVGPDDDDDPVVNVTIQVTGDKDGYRGPFYGTTGSDGKYGIVFGEFGKVGEVKFRAEAFGPNVHTSDEPEWETTENCHEDDAVQIVEIDWVWDEDD